MLFYRERRRYIFIKKRLLALFLALVMLLTAGCSGGQTAPSPATEPTAVPQTEPAQTTAPPPSTEAAEMPEETEPQPLTDVTQQICLPNLAAFGNAVLEDSGTLNENTGLFLYSNVSEEDLNLFLRLCAYCGLFRHTVEQEDGAINYFLFRPGSNYLGCVIPDLANGEMQFQTALDVLELTETETQQLVDYYMQDLVLPTGYGPNVHPQFYASIGRTGADSGALVPNYFGGESEQCWREVYIRVDYPTLHQYLSDMMLCGFDIWYDYVEFDEEEVLTSMIIQLDNGTSQLLIVYHADNSIVNLHYQPGIDRYLLSGAEYALCIPQM